MKKYEEIYRNNYKEVRCYDVQNGRAWLHNLSEPALVRYGPNNKVTEVRWYVEASHLTEFCGITNVCFDDLVKYIKNYPYFKKQATAIFVANNLITEEQLFLIETLDFFK